MKLYLYSYLYQCLPIQNTDAANPYSLRQEAKGRYDSAMAVEMLEKIDKTPGFLNLLWTSDEAHLHLD